MADVMGHFLRGHAAGQAEQEHAQAMEQSKLQQLILKHRLEGLKIEDQIRTRELAKQNFDFTQGQPAADIPSDTVTAQQPNLPAQNLAGMVTGLIRGRQPMVGNPLEALGGASPDQTGSPDTAVEPARIPAPAAQAAVTGTNPVERQVPRAMTIPGVEGLGVPGLSRRPQSMEDIVRAQIQLKRAEQPAQIVGPEASLVGTNISTGAPEVRYTNPTKRPNNSEFGQFQQIYAEGLGAHAFDELTAPQKAGAIPAFTKAKQDPDVQAQLAEGRDLNIVFKNFMMAQSTAAAEDRRAAAAARDEQRQFTEDHRLYQDEITKATRQHTDAMKQWAAEQPFIFNGVNTNTNKPAMALPEYTPPTFEEWQASRGAPKPPKDTGVAMPGDVALPKDGKKPATGSKQVTLAELQKIAAKNGTTVDAERARAIDAGYAVVK